MITTQSFQLDSSDELLEWLKKCKITISEQLKETIRNTPFTMKDLFDRDLVGLGAIFDVKNVSVFRELCKIEDYEFKSGKML